MKFIDAFFQQDDIKDAVSREDIDYIYETFQKKYPGSAMLLTRFFTSHGIDPLEYVTTIHEEMYRGNFEIEEVVVPDGIKIIGVNAFRESGLWKLHVPSSVKTIGLNAFLDCITLEDILYDGTVEQWNYINNNNTAYKYMMNDVVVHCKDGLVNMTAI